METKEYIDVKEMTKSFFNIFCATRDKFMGNTDEIDDIITNEFSDDYLWELAEDNAWETNADMKRYLHQKSHSIWGNFADIEYDYSGDVNDLISRLDSGDESEQTKADKRWLNEWFFSAFGTGGIEYNFGELISATISENEDSEIA